MIKQRTFLREERRRLRIGAERIAERENALKLIQRHDWIPQSMFSTNEKHIRINIGGLMFEIPESILRRDPKSLLAQLCNPDPPVLADPDGFFYFDRDWWLFRYILIFMRDGTLPSDRNLLAHLYREAGFWNLEELQHAIEEEKLHLRMAPEDKEKLKQWWRKSPSWLQAVDEATKKQEEETKKEKEKADWWKDTQYKGKIFLPLSTMSDKIVTKKGEKDAKTVPTTVWSSGDYGDTFGEYHSSERYNGHRNKSKYSDLVESDSHGL